MVGEWRVLGNDDRVSVANIVLYLILESEVQCEESEKDKVIVAANLECDLKEIGL